MNRERGDLNYAIQRDIDPVYLDTNPESPTDAFVFLIDTGIDFSDI